MFTARPHRRRYVRGRDAAGHRVAFYVQPALGVGAALYRKDGELIAVFPFLEGTGALRAELRDAALVASWPAVDPDERW